MYEVKIGSLISPYEHPAAPVPFVEKIILSPSNYLGTVVENQLTTYVRVCFWTQLHSGHLCVSVCAHV